MPGTGLFIIFAGPPGCGKSTIAQALAKRLRAAYLRIDSIEHAAAYSKIAACAPGWEVGFIRC